MPEDLGPAVGERGLGRHVEQIDELALGQLPDLRRLLVVEVDAAAAREELAEPGDAVPEAVSA